MMAVFLILNLAQTESGIPGQVGHGNADFFESIEYTIRMTQPAYLGRKHIVVRYQHTDNP